ncbi:hypothetical protein E4631_15555 [Hymenobacter sp. UV11]|uniref:hypothetical protein n=1 Tax=Hymenobacter sp. UV11 TaxID=1849735 RepID=UPI00105BD634|nr:hypothetical protein [Hymenobacter sp. UV11]TDN39286.1 hypothetical protein A8B98_18680 [Hymenobacter sp. UV11]TFZ65633.1 hypothetical protein E4631_15555 [Hymenobacter sp. UV11]
MKKLLLASLSLLTFTACHHDHECDPAPMMVAPKPTPVPTADATFRVYDAIFLNQFNTAINVNVFYLADSYSVQEIGKLFGGTTLTPIPPDTTWTIRHAVGPDAYDADPGSFTRKLKVGKRVMLTWSYPEADPNAAPRYRTDAQLLGVLTANQPVKVGITIDRGRAGL